VGPREDGTLISHSCASIKPQFLGPCCRGNAISPAYLSVCDSARAYVGVVARVRECVYACAWV
jgi:hypothetical protein